MDDQVELVFDAAEYDRLARSACFVCAIVAGRPLLPDPQIVYEDARMIAFLNQFPTQDGYTLVCPKQHVERFEVDMTPDDWGHLQRVVQLTSRAVAAETGAIRMYVASLGSPERNAHLHVHVCPCPAGTPLELQQFAAMRPEGGVHRFATADRLRPLARRIRGHIDQIADQFVSR